MVNQSALEKLIRFIEANRLRPMMRWGERRQANKKDNYWRKLKKNVRRILSLISGGDIVSMLKSNDF
jgi:hypothetical protein